MTILVIDAGSSSTRALLFNEQAEAIPGAVVSYPHQMVTTPPGAATLEAEALRERIETCLDTLLQHPEAQTIRAVGMATFTGNVLGVDRTGKALTPIYTYAETRSAEDVETLKARLDGEQVHQRTGCILHTAYQHGRLAWLRRSEPALFGQVRKWVDFGAYLYLQWFGESPTSYSVASWSGMLNREHLMWDSELLNALELDAAALPALADVGDARRGLTDDYAARWPALQDVPFYLAVGDGAAANIGSGCANPAQVALTVGTTAALRMVTDEGLPPVPEGLWSYRVDATHHLIGGATSEGGNIFQWARDTLRLEVETLDDQLAGREADQHGLTFLPLLAGERSPGWATHATGAVGGLRLSTTPLDIMQAALEGVALRLSLIADQLNGEFSVTGGGGALAASPAWAQMIANALNRPLHLTEEAEITACGVAILALHALGQCELTDFPPVISHVVEPQAQAAERLRAARDRQNTLYSKWVDSGELYH